MAGVAGKRCSAFRTFTDSLTRSEKKRICLQINKEYGILSNLLFGNYFPTSLDHSFVAGQPKSRRNPIRILQKFIQKEDGVYRDLNVKYYDMVVTLCNFLNGQIPDDFKEDAKRLENRITYLDLVRYTQFSPVRARVIIRKIASLGRPDDPKTIEELMCDSKIFPTEVLVAMTIFRKYVIDNKLDGHFDATWSVEQYNGTATPTEDQNKAYFKLISSTQTRLSETLQIYHEIRTFLATKDDTMGQIRAESNPQTAEFESKRLKDKVHRLILAAENAKKQYEEAVEMMKTFEDYDQERVEDISNLLKNAAIDDELSRSVIPERLFINRRNLWSFAAGDELFAEDTKTVEEVDRADVKAVLFDENFMQQYEGVDINELPPARREETETEEETSENQELFETKRKKTRAPAKAYNKKDKLDALIGPDVPSTSRYRPPSPQATTSRSTMSETVVFRDSPYQSDSSSPSQLSFSSSELSLPRRRPLVVKCCRNPVSTIPKNDETSWETSSQGNSRESSPEKRKDGNSREKGKETDGESDERGGPPTDQDEVTDLATDPAPMDDLATSPRKKSTSPTKRAEIGTSPARGTSSGANPAVVPAVSIEEISSPTRSTRLTTNSSRSARTSSQSSQEDRSSSSNHSRRSTRPTKIDQMLENIQEQYHRPLKQSPNNSPVKTTKKKEKDGRRGRSKKKTARNNENELEVDFEVENPIDENAPGNPDQHDPIQPKTEFSTGQTNLASQIPVQVDQPAGQGGDLEEAFQEHLRLLRNAEEEKPEVIVRAGTAEEEVPGQNEGLSYTRPSEPLTSQSENAEGQNAGVENLRASRRHESHNELRIEPGTEQNERLSCTRPSEPSRSQSENLTEDNAESADLMIRGEHQAPQEGSRPNGEQRENQNSRLYCTRPSTPPTGQVEVQPGQSEEFGAQNETRRPGDQNEPINPPIEDQNVNPPCTRTSEPLSDLNQGENPRSCPSTKQKSTPGIIMVKPEPVSDEETAESEENLAPESRQLAPPDDHEEVQRQILLLSTIKMEVDACPDFISRFKSKKRQREEQQAQQQQDLDLRPVESDQPDISADLSGQELQIDEGDQETAPPNPVDQENPTNFDLTHPSEAPATSNSEQQNRPVDNLASQNEARVDVGIQNEAVNQLIEDIASVLRDLEAQSGQSQPAGRNFPTTQNSQPTRQTRPTSQSSQNLTSSQSMPTIANAPEPFFQPPSPSTQSPPKKRRKKRKSPEPSVPPNFGPLNPQWNLALGPQINPQMASDSDWRAAPGNSNDLGRRQQINQAPHWQPERSPEASRRPPEFQSSPLRQPQIPMASHYQPQNPQIPGLDYRNRPSTGPSQPILGQVPQNQCQNMPYGTFEEWYRAVGQQQGANPQNIVRFFPPVVTAPRQDQMTAPGSFSIQPTSTIRFPNQPGPSAPSQLDQNARLACQMAGYGPNVGQGASNEPNRSQNQFGSPIRIQNQVPMSAGQVQYHQRSNSQAVGYAPREFQMPYHDPTRRQQPFGPSGSFHNQAPTASGQVQHQQGSCSQVQGYGVRVSQGPSNDPRVQRTEFAPSGGHQQRAGTSTGYLQQYQGSANQIPGYDPRLGQAHSYAQSSSQPQFGASGGYQQQAGPSGSQVQHHQRFPNQTEYAVPRTGRPLHRLLPNTISANLQQVPMEILGILGLFEYPLNMSNPMNPFDQRDFYRMIDDLNNDRLFDHNGQQITSIEHLGAWIVYIRKKVVAWYESTTL
ncbi:unnamed protein product [Bursaphelenchus xylophilus]|uniref:(pine wood nematode) hypothetical protein n=1 Tax=Bursaphelenchus xylophilus TaxID=6326 RepID=A0A1I7S1Z4_BURXY|nr:unnamed protein product [Bursaphelenchus xylophilus]CAG9090152.1 unnamed protein product [Bursaphelenchus xylophilus]